ncbi:MAG: sensor histidine kinase [Planctomycetales bacterium]|nr:sensor histidine kinase [Planctomycetales bacterium]NIM09247.1 sensor histidine kinase [Planctomycetales bacterium]NIN08717.1 sensor histidine kinase [Planctomycetales bacterium]NIN77833.1 sensor histidine kinase [Planctomycetales bacterium]NIO35012.1 sensor histidine kinase [Planctomycetales bacterium]
MQPASEQQPRTSEQEIAMLRRRLADAQRMTALGELMSTTTHEFNNVLMTIINYAKIGMRHKDEPTRDKAFDKILAAGNRAAKITNGILGAARNRSDDFAPTDLAKLVEDTLVLLERELSKYRISVERQLDDVPPAMVNPNQIQQVLLNLLINARQALSQGGLVIVKLVHDRPAGMISLTVRDNGKGIPQDHLPRIFDPYFTTKDGPDETGKGGTGVGLATCRDIIEMHKGKIQVASTVGKGTAFTLKLPVAGTATEQAPVTVRVGIPDRSSEVA